MKIPLETFDTLKEIGLENKETQLLLISLYIEDTPALIDALKEKATAQNSIETKKAAHTLKGTCLNLGFTPIAEICMKIESHALSSQFEAIYPLIHLLEETHTALVAECRSLFL